MVYTGKNAGKMPLLSPPPTRQVTHHLPRSYFGISRCRRLRQHQFDRRAPDPGGKTTNNPSMKRLPRYRRPSTATTPPKHVPTINAVLTAEYRKAQPISSTRFTPTGQHFTPSPSLLSPSAITFPPSPPPSFFVILERLATQSGHA